MSSLCLGSQTAWVWLIKKNQQISKIEKNRLTLAAEQQEALEAKAEVQTEMMNSSRVKTSNTPYISWNWPEQTDKPANKWINVQVNSLVRYKYHL